MKIKQLTLYTTNLQRQQSFYSDVLAIPVAAASEEVVEYQVGTSLLRFKKSATAKPYHFAFNIPSEMEKEYLSWLEERVEILPAHGHKLVDFSSWNAKAMYFYDLDKNIVEFIARKSLKIAGKHPVDIPEFAEMSEIGMPVDDIESVFKQLHQDYGFEIYDGDFDRFCAVGDEHGLFILVDKNKKDWFPLDDKAYSADFQIMFETDAGTAEIAFVNGKICR